MVIITIMIIVTMTIGKTRMGVILIPKRRKEIQNPDREHQIFIVPYVLAAVLFEPAVFIYSIHLGVSETRSYLNDSRNKFGYDAFGFILFTNA